MRISMNVTMNIQTLLLELSANGITDNEIGKEINAPQSIVTRLKNGIHKSTSFERGIKIQQMHSRIVLKQS